MQDVPWASTSIIINQLEQTTLPVGNPGFSNLTGFGLIQVTPFTANLPSDRFELNETSNTPTVFGTLGRTHQTYNNLTIGTHPSGLPDYDWYKWSMGTSGTFTATMNIAQASGVLEMHLFTLHGHTLVELASTSGARDSSLSLSTKVTAGQTILVEMKGANTFVGRWDQGYYSMSESLS
jgi:hypothetical protein